MRRYTKPLLLILFTSLLLMLTIAIQGVGQEAGTPNNITELNKSIENGTSYLYGAQLPSGQFASYYSNYPEMSPIKYVYVTFDTAFILHTLNLVDDENTTLLVDEMKGKAVAFLLNETMPNGVWNFRGESDPGYPPDTDDTSMIFASLVESGVNLSNESLDYMLNYTTPKGVFYTWIINDSANNTIDANVNANVLYAYSLRNRSQSGIIQFLNLYQRTNGTLYYPSPYVFTYFVTRDYSEVNVRELEPSIGNISNYLLKMQKSDGSWGNDLDTALATVSLLNIGYKGAPLDNAINHILSTQRDNGSWNISAFYVGVEPPSPNRTYYGSQELTTSFSLEALIKYRNSINSTRPFYINNTVIDRNGFKYQIQNPGLYKITADNTVHYLDFGLTGNYNGNLIANLSTDYRWMYSGPVWNGDGYNITGITTYPWIMKNVWDTTFIFTSQQTEFDNIIKNPYPKDITNGKLYYIISLNNGDEIVYNGVSYNVTPNINEHFSGNLNNMKPNLKINDRFLFDYTYLFAGGFNITDVYITNATTIGINSPLKIGAIGFTKGNGTLEPGQSIKADSVIGSVTS